MQVKVYCCNFSAHHDQHPKRNQTATRNIALPKLLVSSWAMLHIPGATLCKGVARQSKHKQDNYDAELFFPPYTVADSQVNILHHQGPVSNR